MSEALETARAFAARFRYCDDVASDRPLMPKEQTTRIRSAFYQSALRLGAELTPSLYASVLDVCRRLQIPTDAVEAFVTASPEIQAECYSVGESCVLRFSSALVDILDDREFAFVAGHEIGHFLLGHTGTHAPDSASLEHFMIQRAQEVSADRLGYLAVGSVDVAVRALMKTISGLTNQHLRFDPASFVAQIRAMNPDAAGSGLTATHPSIVVRCRALLWFAMEPVPVGAAQSEEVLKRLDRRVKADFDRYVEGPAQQRISDAKRNVGIWAAAVAILDDGKWTKHEQAAFAELFGEDALKSMKSFVQGCSADELRALLPLRQQSAEGELRALVPQRGAQEIDDIKRRIAVALAGDGAKGTVRVPKH